MDIKAASDAPAYAGRAGPGHAMSPAKLLELFRAIDAREWDPPQPLERMLETVESLPRGMKVVMLAPCEPRPLFRTLRASGFDYRCKFMPQGYFEVTVWHAADTPAASADLE